MTSVRSDVEPQSARDRRALPSRSRWPLVILVVAIVAVSGVIGWAGYSGRLSGANLPKFLTKYLPGSSGQVATTPKPVVTPEPVVKGKGKGRGKGRERLASPTKAATDVKTTPPGESPSLETLRSENASMAQELRAMAPTGFYVVINTAGNRVILHNGDKVEAEMIASCGSGNVLEDPKGGRRWTFDTPRGVFTVKTKVVDPVWIKPDWAFIEEGESIPKNRADRAEPGMMGDFAIGIGDGYYLHGTLYSRLLGRNVSHGCVRLGDADIDRLYHTLAKGDRVYIY